MAKHGESGGGTDRDPAERVGVVGAGAMGAGIAAWCALRGADTVLISRRPGAAAGAAARHARRARRRPEGSVGRLAGASDLAAVAGCGVVIEAVEEDLATKRALLGRLEARCDPDALLASTTSSLSIGALAAALADPSRLVGVHFLNPVAVLPLVEIVAGGRTAPGTLERAHRFVRAIGKQPLPVPDRPGFVVNRLFFPGVLEALRACGEGVAPATIDAAARAAGVLAGPCAGADMVGLDVLLRMSDILSPALGDAFAAPALLRAAVAAGRLGRKAGRGLYAYGHAMRPDPELGALLPDGPRPATAARAPFATERLLVPTINEAIAALVEGIPAAVVDTAARATLGMEPGPLARLAGLGVERHLALAEALCRTHGPRFAPPDGVRPRLAAVLGGAAAEARP
jgi:3-hydroxyacyl-CoA dehydrogenase / enoyl-CoA hydratase / 3-hydroxybutyryl-CoA epimerase